MIQFRRARVDECEVLQVLINAAYRSRGGWTHECDLLEGARISREALRSLILGAHLETAWADGLVGCVHLQRPDQPSQPCCLGLLSVFPGHQARGVGRQLLSRAEELARSWHCPAISLTVLRQRSELVAYYERRGYELTGVQLPFPYHEQVGRAKRDDLELVEMVRVF